MDERKEGADLSRPSDLPKSTQLQLLYENATTEIEHAKQTGWRIVFSYAAAAAFLVGTNERSLFIVQISILFIVGFFGALFAIGFLYKTRARIRKYRDRMINLYQKEFDSDLLNRIDPKILKKPKESGFEILIFASQVIFVATMFLAYSLPSICKFISDLEVL